MPESPAFLEVIVLKRWMSTWSGIGHRHRDGTASVHSHAMIAADGIGTAPTPFARRGRRQHRER
jgi:hypothetical protein